MQSRLPVLLVFACGVMALSAAGVAQTPARTTAPQTASAPLKITARPGLPTFTPAWPSRGGGTSWRTDPSHADRLTERAHHDREAIVRLQAPDTGTYEIEHDYTETRPGVGDYVEILAAGTTATRPSARNLDTGDVVTLDVLTGEELNARGIDAGERVAAGEQVIVGAFAKVAAGRSVRLRVATTFADPAHFSLDGELPVLIRARRVK